MFNIKARNVNEAWAMFHVFASNPIFFRDLNPRGVKTSELKEPTTTTYARPEECVLLDPVRDANPFFHLYESLWILAGRNDVARLRYYNPQIQVYSDNQETFHGAYGYRMQHASGVGNQITAAITTLREDRNSRRAVIGLWMPSLDLVATAEQGADIPCNTTIYFKVREGALRMMVCNRSNDAVWGAYGANAVQFSFLQQYVAAAIEAKIGPYTQVSDSLHVYREGKAGEVWDRCREHPPILLDSYAPEALGVTYNVPLVQDHVRFKHEADCLTSPADGTPGVGVTEYREPFVNLVALPLLIAFEEYRKYGPESGLLHLSPVNPNAWIRAGREWLERRVASRKQQRAAA